MRSSFLLRGAVFVIGVLLVGLPAFRAEAQEPTFAVQNFTPTVNPTNYFVTESGRLIPHLGITAGLVLNYAHRPLRLVGNNFERELVGYQVGMDLLVGMGFWNWVELGVHLPVVLGQNTEGLSPLGRLQDSLSAGLGDLRIIPKGRLFSASFFTLGLALPFSVPTGSKDNLLSEDGMTFTPTLIGSFDWKRFGAAVNIGYRIRKDQSFTSPGGAQRVAIADEIPLSVAARYNVWRELDLVADLYWAVGVEEQDQEEVPVELLWGARYRFPHNIVAHLGLGTGLTAGIGAPDVRVLGGIAITPGWEKPKPPPPPVDRDPDKDGILNPDDNCPTDPEDKDGFEDTDGCPDTDNDRDGILDKEDKCPNEAEDKDNFEDSDGCPDLDNDRDGIVDTTDKCPNEAEDKDGFEDEDGCPDTDNDKDGIPDAKDKCPNQPEVVNGFEDEDGCPDVTKGPVQIQNGRITVPTVYFATGRDIVLKRSLPTLHLVADLLQKNLWIKKIRIEGHTDDRGRDQLNLDLSLRRAQSVMKTLVDLGVDQVRIEAEGYGKTRPIASNKTAKGRSTNRRVDFIIIDPPFTPSTAPATTTP